MEKGLNQFYMAKYGIFTCHDAVLRMEGTVQFAEDLIEHWTRNKEDQRYSWNLAIAYVLTENRNFDWNILEKYRKDYRQSKAY